MSRKLRSDPPYSVRSNSHKRAILPASPTTAADTTPSTIKGGFVSTVVLSSDYRHIKLVGGCYYEPTVPHSNVAEIQVHTPASINTTSNPTTQALQFASQEEMRREVPPTEKFRTILVLQP